MVVMADGGDGGVRRTQWGFIVCRLSAVHSYSEHRKTIEALNERCSSAPTINKVQTIGLPPHSHLIAYLALGEGEGVSHISPCPCDPLTLYLRHHGKTFLMLYFNYFLFLQIEFQLVDIVQALKGLGLPD